MIEEMIWCVETLALGSFYQANVVSSLPFVTVASLKMSKSHWPTPTKTEVISAISSALVR